MVKMPKIGRNLPRDEPAAEGRIFTEKEMKGIRQSIEALEDKNFCPSCWMILSFDVVNVVSVGNRLQASKLFRSHFTFHY